MRTLLIACGNTLRGDDGVAAAVLGLIEPAANRRTLAVQQLAPELAQEIAEFDRVVFIDADAASSRVTIEHLNATVSPSPLTHVSTPSEIMALSTALFGFGGEAFLCRVPARDFSPSASVGRDTLQFARSAAEELDNLI